MTEKKIVGKLKSFNEVMYKDCFYHALIPTFRHFTGFIEPLLLNDICLEYSIENQDKVPTLIMKNASSQSYSDIFEKFGISVKKSRISSKKMIDHTIEVLNNDGIAIIRIDCFYEPLRIDSYQKYHAGHVIPIYGYDNTRNMFDILEGDFVDSVVYDAKKLEYEHVRNAYKGYIEEFKTHNHTYYEFKKVDNSVDYKKEYEVRKNNFTEYFQSNSDVFLESLKEINNYKQKLSNYFANGINDNISTIVTSFNRMLDEVVVQKYLFSKLFELPSEYSVVIDETIRLTNEKFIVNGGHKGKIYCTGDIVHIENDGLINIMGREDSQVKINGYRVEVNEIKNIMLEFASIDFAEIDVEDQDIIAYIKESKNIEYDELYDFLGERLSTYMLPKRIYVVKKIALTLNGKIDFKIMKKSGKLLQSNNPITKPETDMEKALYKLWKQLLNCEEEFSIEDNFFSVGGTSILGIELLSYLNLDNFEYQDLLENSSIKKLACVIEMKKGSIKEIDELKMPDCLTDYVDKKEVRYMVKPFNKVYYEDCIYNAIFSAFDYFNIELRYFLSHELPTLDESNFIFKRDNNMVKIDCHINKVYGEDFIKGDFVGNSNVIDKIRTALLNKNIPIVRIDCYYEKYRKEFYNKSHFMHALCITGFNDFEKKLYALEHSNVNSLDYKEIEISYQEVINANFAYEYFTGYTRESYYEVSKIKDSSYLQKDPVRDFVQYICKHKSVLKKNISKTNVVMVEGKFALDNTELFSDRLIQMRIFLKMEIFKAELLVDDEQVKNPIIESNKIFEKMFQIVLVKKMRKQSLDLTETDKSNMKYALTLLREYFSKLLKWADNKVEEMSTNNKEIKILENRIKELFYQVTNIDQDIDVNRKLTDYGINSITIIEFLVKIEDEFDIEFDIENMTVEKFESLHDLCDYVQSNSQNLDNCKTY